LTPDSRWAIDDEAVLANAVLANAVLANAVLANAVLAVRAQWVLTMRQPLNLGVSVAASGFAS